jgi:hypothetical protein
MEYSISAHLERTEIKSLLIHVILHRITLVHPFTFLGVEWWQILPRKQEAKHNR